MMEMFNGIPKYIPEICKDAQKRGNHYECGHPCLQMYKEEKFICPCFGKDGSGWISADMILMKQIEDVERWNECRKKIPCETAWKLKGYAGFSIMKYELRIERFGKSLDNNRKKKLLRLFKNGERIGFNEDWGVGHILSNDDNTFTVEKWVYGNRSNPVNHGTLDDVIGFLHGFWDEN